MKCPFKKEKNISVTGNHTNEVVTFIECDGESCMAYWSEIGKHGCKLLSSK